MDESNSRQMQTLIAAALDADPNSPASVIADEIASGSKTIFRAWALERLALAIGTEIRARERRAKPTGPYQMFLEGFSNMAEPLRFKGGGKVPLASATIMDLRKNLKTMMDRASLKARCVVNLIEEMRPYAKVRRGITVERYCELRAAGITANSLRDNPDAR
jgi:hypothetical protein